MRGARHVSLLWAAIGLGACGSSVPPSDAGNDALVVPMHSCGRPEVPGNEQGVGAFCSPAGRQCSAHPLAPLCLADLAPAEEQWYCTRTCVMDSQCGTDAMCVGDSRGHGCVPNRCPLGSVVDSGATSDAGATSDTGVDAGP